MSRCGESLAALMRTRNDNGSVDEYLERRAILEASLPAYSKTAEKILFEYDQPGLRFSFETGPYSGSHTRGTTLGKFKLDYDPSKFSRFSIVRRTLGNRPRTLTEADIEHYSQTRLVGDEGTLAEIYPKGGGLIMVNRDTGQIRFYEPGTDVDGNLSGAVRGSVAAIWDFAKGLAGEMECAICKHTGRWTADPHIIEVTPSRRVLSQ